MFLVALAELAFVGIGTSAYLKQRRDSQQT
jgi:hypothetical protein